ncbi:MAG: bifunctional UDP-N-acetylglucosamine diphosphorylase/glucosamine-1-phosphate N-acetyltransferase GlmU [Magnetococcales bacterium]|nr:bifunctional UDP-N-acetylglucosamine diphosphorylase/glucosamine-1-phosphate N-acetyltransferase GlmU [Magnetococcales bacterium]
MKLSAILVLAAGRGTRMRSSLPKVLHALAGRPLLAHVLDGARRLAPQRLAVVIGHGGEQVRQAFPDADLSWIEQTEQKGTAHAVSTALPLLEGLEGEVIVLNGDTPLVDGDFLEALLTDHRQQQRAVTVVSTLLETPRGYGRVVRDGEGELLSIVEEKDASPVQREIREVNAGVYCIDLSQLAPLLARITPHNAQGEFYLTDIISLGLEAGLNIGVFCHEDAASLAGINSRQQLAGMEALYRDRLVRRFMDEGVTFVDPTSCWLAWDVALGTDCIIEPHVILGPGVSIGEGCHIGPFCQLRHSRLGPGCEVSAFSHLDGVVAQGPNAIGPYARLRPGTQLAARARVGNFCETKKAIIGEGAKINHLSYLGDCQVGADVNVGAGTITCNYDGVNKHTTIIEEGAFIGSDTQLVAPVTVGHHAVVGAGTTVTKDVPPEALAVSRTAQTHILNWRRRKIRE